MNNPFFQQPMQSQNFSAREDNSGWTVTRPTPAPRQDVKKPQLSTQDPFAFLNNQTGSKNSSEPYTSFQWQTMAVTRAQLTCPVYGIQCELASHKLLLTILHNIILLNYNFPGLPSTIVSRVSKIVTDIWLKSDISTVTIKRSIKASVSIASDIDAENTSIDEEFIDTQSNAGNYQLSDFCDTGSKFGGNMKFPTVTKECDRYGVSDAVGTAELIIKTLIELFQEVFDRYKSDKEGNQKESQEKNNLPADNVQETETFDKNEINENQTEGGLLNWDTLNDQIKVMQNDVNEDSSFMTDFQGQKQTTNPFDDDNFVFKTEENIDLFGSVSLFSDTTTVKTNNNASDDLFNLIASPPPAPERHFSDDFSDGSLLISDPFAELKKNINELHKQTKFQQQQPFGYQGVFPSTPVAFPQYQQSGFQNSLYHQPQLAVNNPFAPTAKFPLNVASHHQAPNNAVPLQPAMNNPFFQQPMQSQNFSAQEDNSGWTVTRPTPAPRQDVKKPQLSTQDPFAFLNNQTGSKNSTVSASSPKLLKETSTPRNDVFDLLS
ncbi:uncharacterized protein LOC124806298 [Hydra vulgaris]|uniref:uncharacterized protein LOC124806298 n=1 Tax=Hydra vulgaris TaxID=6087 RepID=UPI0032E9D776